MWEVILCRAWLDVLVPPNPGRERPLCQQYILGRVAVMAKADLTREAYDSSEILVGKTRLEVRMERRVIVQQQ